MYAGVGRGESGGRVGWVWWGEGVGAGVCDGSPGGCAVCIQPLGMFAGLTLQANMFDTCLFTCDSWGGVTCWACL
jgi:hypothetical protein